MKRVLLAFALPMLIAPRVSAEEIRIGTIRVAGAGASW